MDADQFLARVIGPGSYAAIAFKNPARGGMSHRFMPRDKLGELASYGRWASGKGNDVYFACASFNASIASKLDDKGKPIADDVRTADNAETLKSFWIDIDVSRPGEGKVKSIYADRREALAWIIGFCAATGLPPPNLWVDSGHGYHVYFVLESEMTRAAWQPYADALAQAIRTHQFKCEAGISSDAARILRPPGTMNCKGGAQVPVRVLDKQSRGDYPNDLILSKLQPFVGITPTTVVSHAGASALAGGAPAAAFAGTSTTMNAAAQANVMTQRPHEFSQIAGKCAQVKQSLATGGNGDPYQLWYLGFLSLAHHCVDGADYIHEISKGDPRYDPARTDAAAARIVAEKARKDRGPPRCTSFDSWRPGVCTGCPFAGKVASPWSLGTADGDLPADYRRFNGRIERLIKQPENQFWVELVSGDVYGPLLDEAPAGYALSFTYEFAARRFPVRIMQPEFPHDPGAIASFASGQRIALEDQNATEFRRFIVAWIKTLRSQHLERTELISPWGYAIDDDGSHTGIAIGGTLYRPDGSQEAAPGGDRQMVNDFTPRGSSAYWRRAFDAVCTDRIDLQVMVACSFGAPLMHFTGQSGLIVSAWSQASGVGKSSALKLSQTVWSAPSVMSTTKDTPNAVNAILGMLKIMVFNWDEMHVGKDSAQLVQQAMDVAQGKSKRRMASDTSLRPVSEWQTLVVTAANGPIMDHMAQATAGHDAGAVRALEFKIERPQMDNTGQVARIVKELDRHYGHIGREFIAHVAQHIPETDKLVMQMIETLQVSLGSQQEERMYVAGIASILGGAKIANQLGLAAFDLKGMYTFLRDVVIKLRNHRQKNMLAHNGTLNAEQILGEFYSTYFTHLLVTSHYAKRGPRPKAWKVYESPINDQRVEIHVSVTDSKMRINKATFTDWLKRAKGLSTTVVIDEFKRQFNAIEDRCVLGETTKFAGGRVAVLDIPLTGPGMDNYLPNDTTTPVQPITPALGARKGKP